MTSPRSLTASVLALALVATAPGSSAWANVGRVVAPQGRPAPISGVVGAVPTGASLVAPLGTVVTQTAGASLLSAGHTAPQPVFAVPGAAPAPGARAPASAARGVWRAPADAARVAAAPAAAAPAPVTATAALDIVAEKAAGLTAEGGRLSDGEAKTRSAFELAPARRAHDDAAPVSAGAFSVSRSRLSAPTQAGGARQDPVPAYETSARGQGRAAFVAVALAAAAAAAGFVAADVSPYLHLGALAVAGAAGLNALAYAALSLRAFAATWKAQAPKAAASPTDVVEEAPFASRLASAWKTPVATPEAAAPALELMPAHARAVVERHEASHRNGAGELRAYLAQVPGHARFLAGEVVSALRWVVSLPGRAGRALATIAKVGYAMATGEKAIEHLLGGDTKRAIAWAKAFLIVDAVMAIAMGFATGPLLDVAASAQLQGLALHAVQLGIITGVLMGAFILYTFAERTHAYFSRVAGLKSARDYRIALQRSFLAQEMDFHLENGSAKLAGRLLSDTNYLSNKNVSVRLSVLHYALYLVFGVGMMFYTSVPLSLIVIAAVPVLGWIASRFGDRVSRVTNKISDQKSTLMRRSQESLQQAETVKLFGAREQELARYAKDADEAAALARQEAKLTADYGFFGVSLSDVFTKYLVYFVGGVALAAAFGLTFGQITQLTIFAGFSKYAFTGLSSLYLQYKRYEGASKSVREMVTREPAVRDAEGAAALPDGPGLIAFDNVRFAYPSRQAEPVLKGISFVARPGETVAFVGETGSGKSTITRLLLRLWDAPEGKVTVDGHDIRGVTRSSLLERIAVVPQETRLFNTTLRENMLYGTPGASDERLADAIAKAGADFVHDKNLFPQGLDTPVGEGGGQLSGGQRQRVAIVRALLRDPSILILDEATSALDNKTEREVQRSLDALAGGAGGRRPTTIVIAHRLSTIRRADRINVLEKGVIVESGTHDELLALGGLYARLWKQGGYDGSVAADDAARAWQPPVFGDLDVPGGYGRLRIRHRVVAAIENAALVYARADATAADVVAALEAGGVSAETAAAIIGDSTVDRFGPAMAGISAEAYAALRTLVNGSRGGTEKAPLIPDAKARPAKVTPEAEAAEAAAIERTIAELRQAAEERAAASPQAAGESAPEQAQPTAASAAPAAAAPAPAAKRSWTAGIKSLVSQLRGFVMGDVEARRFIGAGVLVKISALMTVTVGLLLGASKLLGGFLDLASRTTLAASADALLLMGLGSLSLFLAASLFERHTAWVIGSARADALAAVRKDLMSRLLGKSIAFHGANPSAALASHVNEESEALVKKNLDVRAPILKNLLSLVAATALLISVNPAAGTLVFVMLPLLGVINGYYGNQRERLYAVFGKKRAALGETGQQQLELIQTVKTFGSEDKALADYAGKADALAEVGRADARAGAQAHMLSSALTDFFTRHLIYMLGAWGVALAMGLTPGGIVVMTLYAGFVKSAFDGLSSGWLEYKNAHGETTQVREWLAEPLPAAKTGVVTPGAGEIVFDDVSFRYGTDSGGGIHGVSLRVKAGQTVAFVGESGSGKSTLLKLLQGLWAPGAGKVLIDGVDAATLSEESLASVVAKVPQETRLFDDSLRYNMSYGSPAASEAALLAAIKAARAEFVFDKEAFPLGLDTRVGEGGATLSGGQRQRVAIVRALLKNPRVLVLDEATSALDKKTEREIQETLESLTQGASGLKPTTLVVAHNLTTIAGSDLIVVMDQGRIAETGTHAELLAKGGRYARLWQASLSDR